MNNKNIIVNDKYHISKDFIECNKLISKMHNN